MGSLVIAIILTLIAAMGAAVLFNFIRSVRKACTGDALSVYVEDDASGGDNFVSLEFTAGPDLKKVTVERIILDRDFAGRVLAQAPDGFRSRTPEAPPEYHSFEPDLDELNSRHKFVTSGMIAKEKRRQYNDVMEAWEALKTRVVIWEGDFAVRRGHPRELVVPMRADVAATGRFTFIYSYRRGLFTTNATAFAEYRTRLVAVHG